MLPKLLWNTKKNKKIGEDIKINKIFDEINSLRNEINSLRILIDHPDAITNCLSHVYCEFEDKIEEIKKELVSIKFYLLPTNQRNQ